MNKPITMSESIRKKLLVFVALVFALSLFPGFTLVANADEVDDPAIVTTDTDATESDSEDAVEPLDEGEPTGADPDAALAPLATGSPILYTPLAGVAPSPKVPFATYTLDADETKNWQVPLTNYPLPEKMDIMYVVDTTGSMSGRRTIAANTVSGFTSDLVSAGATDIYFGTAFFGDLDYDDPWFGITLPLGNHDPATVSTALSSLTPTGGGDLPEDSVMAYMCTVDETPWRADALHVVVLITDAPSKYRLTFDVDGYPVTLDGALDITNDYNIQLVITSYWGTPLNDLATKLGVPEYTWSNQTELSDALVTAIIVPSATAPDYLCEAKVESITYESDGALSTDIDMSISPASFVLSGGDTKDFDLTALATDSPARFNDRTIVEIGYYIDGVRVTSATQFLYFTAEPPLTTIPATGDTGTIFLLVALQMLLLGLVSLAVWKGHQVRKTS
ncbi:MAG: VWA domain-containing protein [Coriobacteriia bacterium]|nr:VWA domain-containing protein [Coriobacteriia bacterium]